MFCSASDVFYLFSLSFLWRVKLNKHMNIEIVCEMKHRLFSNPIQGESTGVIRDLAVTANLMSLTRCFISFFSVVVIPVFVFCLGCRLPLSSSNTGPGHPYWVSVPRFWASVSHSFSPVDTRLWNVFLNCILSITFQKWD